MCSQLLCVAGWRPTSSHLHGEAELGDKMPPTVSCTAQFLTVWSGLWLVCTGHTLTVVEVNLKAKWFFLCSETCCYCTETLKVKWFYSLEWWTQHPDGLNRQRREIWIHQTTNHKLQQINWTLLNTLLRTSRTHSFIHSFLQLSQSLTQPPLPYDAFCRINTLTVNL